MDIFGQNFSIYQFCTHFTHLLTHSLSHISLLLGLLVVHILRHKALNKLLNIAEPKKKGFWGMFTVNFVSVVTKTLNAFFSIRIENY